MNALRFVKPLRLSMLRNSSSREPLTSASTPIPVRATIAEDWDSRCCHCWKLSMLIDGAMNEAWSALHTSFPDANEPLIMVSVALLILQSSLSISSCQRNSGELWWRWNLKIKLLCIGLDGRACAVRLRSCWDGSSRVKLLACSMPFFLNPHFSKLRRYSCSLPEVSWGSCIDHDSGKTYDAMKPRIAVIPSPRYLRLCCSSM